MGAYRSFQPPPSHPPVPARRQPRRRRSHSKSRAKQGQLLWLGLALLIALYAQSQGSVPTARPEPTPPPGGVMLDQMTGLLPPGSILTQSLPLESGVVALAWQEGESAWTGAALPRPGGGYRLWRAVTPGQGDVAERTQVSLIRLPGLPEEVLVSQYTTDGCCSWVNLFALGETPRVLFASPTSYSRLYGGTVKVRRLLPGEYPDGAASDTDTYSWDGLQFVLSGTSLAPQHYFPLAQGLRWTYRTPDGRLERWVQSHRTEGQTAEYLVRAAALKGELLHPVPDSTYVYGSDGSVLQQQPNSWQLLPPTPGMGSTWRMSENETAEVVEVRQHVKVPAGLFSDVLVVQRPGVRQYYVPHVGLIREERGGRVTLELVEFVQP